MRYAGTYLVVKEQIYKGDAMVVLMGSIADRVLEASDIYRSGYASRLLIVEEYMGPSEMLSARGAHLITNSAQCRSIATELGIPADSISLLPGGARSTAMEAQIISSYLKNAGGVDTLLIITAPSHTRRAVMVFRNAFRKAGLEVTVIACPTRYHYYNGKGWFKRKEDIERVVFEYIKLTSFFFIERFRRLD